MEGRGVSEMNKTTDQQTTKLDQQQDKINDLAKELSEHKAASPVKQPGQPETLAEALDLLSALKVKLMEKEKKIFELEGQVLADW